MPRHEAMLASPHSARAFRLGSTSYVYPDDILPNVRQLGPLVDDVELVLFEVPEASNLPDAATLDELARLAEAHDLTYTVHLPLDLRVVPEDPSMPMARRIIALTRPLRPYAYIAHLDAREPMRRCGPLGEWDAWRDACTAGLAELAAAAGGANSICIENLERWPHGEMLPILDRLPVELCLDIGHLWLQGLDAAACIAELAPRTRVVHLHGIDGRDHKSLRHVPRPQLGAALDALARAGFDGVLTLEVFNLDDFVTSRDLVLAWAKGAL
jgi:sugar phosphate isomerase/epimerase